MHRKQSLRGKRVGDWEVIGFVGMRGHMRFWRCRCRCGYERDFSTSYLNTGGPSRCPLCRKALRGAAEAELVALLVGRTFGDYTVLCLIGRNKYGSRVWRCRCACGYERDFITSYLSGNGKRSATRCPTCTQRAMEQRNCLRDEVPQRLWQRLLGQAKRRNVAVYLAREDAEDLLRAQGSRCALSGIELRLTRLRTNFNRYTTASVDRIDSSRPYEIGNVQWVHKVVNMMKGSLTQEEFKTWCHAVADFSGNRPIQGKTEA